MGIGFLAMLAGILNVDQQLFEAGAIDGIRNRTQEIFLHNHTQHEAPDAFRRSYVGR